MILKSTDKKRVSKRMVKGPNPIDMPDELIPEMPNDGDDF